jgi:hypothetical protein
MKKFLLGLVAGFLLVSMPVAFANMLAPVSFSDVNESDWFYDSVTNLANWRFVNGYSDGTFGPSNLITRAETAKIVNEVFEQTYNGPELAELTAKYEALNSKVSTLSFPGVCYYEDQWYQEKDYVGDGGCTCIGDGRVICPSSI